MEAADPRPLTGAALAGEAANARDRLRGEPRLGRLARSETSLEVCSGAPKNLKAAATRRTTQATLAISPDPRMGRLFCRPVVYSYIDLISPLCGMWYCS
jgi:hypothetical protein